jgi:transposase
MMPDGKSDQRAAVRQRAFDTLATGLKPAEVAQCVGVTKRSVRRWQQEARGPTRKKTKCGPGRLSFPSKQQPRQFERALARGAYAHGYAEDYWTADRIGHVTWKLFGVRNESSGVLPLLQRMGCGRAGLAPRQSSS